MMNVSGVTFAKLLNSELDCLKISNPFCEATISFQGAQVLEFFSKTQNKSLLWLSDLNNYSAGKAIRGGIPLCFPWFGASKENKDFPAHGFARNLIWSLLDITVDAMGHHIVFELNDRAETRQYWDFAFSLQMKIHFGEQLELELTLTNQDQVELECEFVWHSYFPAMTKTAQIHGLVQTEYIDQLDGNILKIQQDQQILFTQEEDRIYPQTAGKFVLEQNVNQRIFIESTAQSAVIWNPWIEKAKRLSDVRDDAWQDFVCLETGQIGSEKLQLRSDEKIHYHFKIN